MAGRHDDKHHHHHGHDWIINGKMIISDVLEVCPEAEQVFVKHLGPLALTIPGARAEAIEFLTAMHDYHEDILLTELNEVCKKAPSKAGHF